MTSLTSPTEFQKKIKEWTSQSPAQRERTLKSLVIARKQAEWNLKQIKMKEQALHAINKNDPLAAIRFAVLSAIDNEEEECDEHQIVDTEIESEDKEEIKAEMDECEDNQATQQVPPPPPGTQYVNGQLQFINKFKATSVQGKKST